MATLILTNLVKSAGIANPIFGAIAMGAAAVIGNDIDQSLFPQQGAGKLKDLKISESRYGAEIPYFWGKVRLPGLMDWAKDLRKRTRRVGGSIFGGGEKVTEYFGTWRDVLGQATYFRTDPDTGVVSVINRNAILKKTWASDIIVKKHIPSFYDGSQTDADSIILAAEGDAPADVFLCVAVHEDFPLKYTGNSKPNTSYEVWTDAVTLQDILEDVSELCGLTSDDYDFSAVAGIAVESAVLAARQAPGQFMQALCDAYACDLVEIDGKLQTVPRGAATVLDLDIDWMGVSTSAKPGQIFKETFKSELELPHRVDLTAMDLNNSYQSITQGAQRIVGSNQNAISADLPLGLTGDDLRKIAERMLAEEWMRARGGETSVGPRYYKLVPSDCIGVPIGDTFVRFKIIHADREPLGPLSITLAYDDPDVLDQVITGSDGGGQSAPEDDIYPVTAAVVWSTPTISRDDQADPGFYAAPVWDEASSSGVDVYYQRPDASDWILVGSLSLPAVIGTASTALADGAAAEAFDLASSVTVVLEQGDLEATSEANVQAGDNYALLGDELLGFAAASLTGALTYDLSTILRGLRSTDMTGHSGGDRFVLLDQAVRFSVPDDLIGLTIQVKFVADGQELADVLTSYPVTIADPDAPYIEPTSAIDPAAVEVTRGIYSGSDEVMLFEPLYDHTVDDPAPAGLSFEWQEDTGSGYVGPDGTADTYWTSAVFRRQVAAGDIQVRVRAKSLAGELGNWVASAVQTYTAPPSTGATWVPFEVATDSGDHQNYTLANTPIAGQIIVYLNGVPQSSGFSITGDTITFTVANDPLDEVEATYYYL